VVCDVAVILPGVFSCAVTPRCVQVDTSVLVKALRHYDDVWDAAVGCGNPGLDCRVLLPCPGLATESSLWGLPELGAIFGQPNETLLDIVEQVRWGGNGGGGRGLLCPFGGTLLLLLCCCKSWG